MTWGVVVVQHPSARSSRKSEDKIKLNLKEIVWEGMYWVYLTEDRGKWRPVLSTVMNLLDP